MQNIFCINLKENYCNNNPCLNGGVCSSLNDENTQYTCSCLNTGYSGTNCQTLISSNNGCNSLICQNGGSCQLINQQAICVCPNGFGGTNCQTGSLYSSCGSSQCQNGASCYQTSSTTYGCACLGVLILKNPKTKKTMFNVNIYIYIYSIFQAVFTARIVNTQLIRKLIVQLIHV